MATMVERLVVVRAACPDAPGKFRRETRGVRAECENARRARKRARTRKSGGGRG